MAKQVMAPEHITKAEAASVYGVSPRTFEKRMERGLAPRSLPGTRRWSRDAVVRAAKFGMNAEPIARAPAPPADDFEALWSAANAR